jgi:cytochrome c-type biogenesis protein CcmH
MITFVILASLLAIGGVALVAIPLLKRSAAQYQPAPWAALAAAGVLLVGSAVLYVCLSNWSWHADNSSDSPQTMVARLARKLERNPDDLNGWLMLGRSYTVLEQYPLAARAFQRADRLAGGKSADALVGEAEALALSDESQLDRRAGRLIEQALQLDPDSGKALFFGAAAALRRGELPLARDRFVKLLALNPPANIKPLLKQQIAAIDQRIAGVPEGPGAAQEAATQGASGTDRARGAATDTRGNGPKVRINVVLAPGLSQSAPGSSPLFVFVRDPQSPGPPLAVKRLQSHFPQTVELSASDSMLPGRTITEGQKVQIVARIARSGNPVGASGDPFGEIGYLVGHDGLINIVIDRITP